MANCYWNHQFVQTQQQPKNARKKQCLDSKENTSNEINIKNFRCIPIIPTLDELKNREMIMKNIVEGNFKDVDNYLETNFRLLRADFITPLRQKIQDLQTSKLKKKEDQNSSIYRYDDIRIGDFEISTHGIIYNLRFDPDKFEKEWENSTRLAFGSLLCMSNDNFKTAVFATVAEKKITDLERGIIKVKFETELDFNSKDRYTILEPQAFFEAYRHVLRGLQLFNNDTLPLQNYLIHVERKLEPPLYLAKKKKYFLKLDQSNDEKRKFSVNVLDINTWPPPETMNLDESQRRAMHLALSSSLAIIQGPPGTGKTHVGLKIIEALLNNKSAWQNQHENNPILVVCYTNHALDQFLEGILKFTNRIVRVGSRSNKAMTNFMLCEILKCQSRKSKREILMLKKQRFKAGKIVMKCKNSEKDALKNSIEIYTEIARKLKTAQNLEQIEVLSNTEIVGMTTTCAARYLDILKEIGPKIVIVEEAAEVLESHVTTCLSKSTQHLILIGDHQQLRPGVNVHELARNYNFDVSLFERMIRNKVPFETLQLQHRMRPEISRLLVPHIYETLKDHPSVQKYPNVRGVAENVFFLAHDIPEEVIDGSSSHANQYEANFLSSFCQYLLQQQYRPSQITILTPYNGQLGLLRKAMSAEIFSGVHVTVVDNFQGEENDIILLSFARSNEADNIGFLKVHNRINVALSRAKIGLFCIGNFRHFGRKSPLWRAIIADLDNHNQIGKSLALTCQTHSHKSLVRSRRDIRLASPNGGCRLICNKKLKCGHLCPLICHNDEHEKCEQICNKFLCKNKHRCPLKCGKECPKCTIMVEKKHEKCNHMLTLKCSIAIKDINCMVRVEKELPCGHPMVVPCYTDINKLICKQNCVRPRNCGHGCVRKCYEKCGNCEKMIVKELLCGHKYTLKCHVNIDQIKCELACERTMDCGHACKRKCNEMCRDCDEIIDKNLKCGHTLSTKCSTNVDEINCRLPCTKTLNCGHICKLKCGVECRECEEMVKKQLFCGHKRIIRCCVDVREYYCDYLCRKILNCGHRCTRRCCDLCVECRTVVKKKLACGHEVTIPCSTDERKLTCTECYKICGNCEIL